MSAHDDYLDPDRAGLNDPQAYRLPVEIPESLGHIEGVYWDEDGWVILNLNPTPTNSEYLTQKIGAAEEEEGAIKVAQGYLHSEDKFPMPNFERGGDGAHCGLTDWYPDKEAELEAALASGRPFSTGWYSSKKEIASARISSEDGKSVVVEVSVSDDFDTDGYGLASCEPTTGAIHDALYEAWSEAGKNQKANRQYIGYSLILWSTKIHFRNNGDSRKRYAKKQAQCVDYLLLPVFVWDEADAPPGDNYYFWGWQNDSDHENDEDCGHNCVEEGIPKRTVARLREFAENHEVGSLRIGDWEIKSWDEEN